jgi:hypothetical protein
VLVPGIEKLCLEAQADSFRDPHILNEADVLILEVRPTQVADPRAVTEVEIEGICILESRPIQKWSFAGIVVVWILQEWIDSRNLGWNTACSELRRYIAITRSEEERNARGNHYQRGDLPSTEYFIEYAASIQEPLSLADRKLV